mgnify:FL=1
MTDFDPQPQPEDATLATLWQFFRALVDNNRLRLVGWLIEGDLTLPEIARRLELKPNTAQRHIDYLTQLGLVEEVAGAKPPAYHFNREALTTLARTLLARAPNMTAAELDVSAFNRKVITDFTNPDGSLKDLPAQEKKLLVILYYLLDKFLPDIDYTEREVAEILRRFHPDTATLRRALVDYGLMERKNNVYRRR